MEVVGDDAEDTADTINALVASLVARRRARPKVTFAIDPEIFYVIPYSEQYAQHPSSFQLVGPVGSAAATAIPFGCDHNTGVPPE